MRDGKVSGMRMVWRGMSAKIPMAIGADNAADRRRHLIEQSTRIWRTAKSQFAPTTRRQRPLVGIDSYLSPALVYFQLSIPVRDTHDITLKTNKFGEE